MAFMCKMDKCKEKKGVCLHEMSISIGVVVVIGAALIFLR